MAGCEYCWARRQRRLASFKEEDKSEASSGASLAELPADRQGVKRKQASDTETDAEATPAKRSGASQPAVDDFREGRRGSKREHREQQEEKRIAADKKADTWEELSRHYRHPERARWEWNNAPPAQPAAPGGSRGDRPGVITMEIANK